MKASSRIQPASWLAAAGLSLAVPTLAQAASGVDGVTAVSAQRSSDYVRAKLPDGSFRPETYAFGEGGVWGGEVKDATIDRLPFIDVAKEISLPLAAQKYLPAKDPAKTKLLIMVYWGTTAVPGPASDSTPYAHFSDAQDAAARAMNPLLQVPRAVQNAALSDLSAATVMLNMENHKNDQIDFANASMLGYDAAGLIGTERGNYVRGTALGAERDDLYAEIQENRYFVVLMAYDFQLLWKEKKHKLLWQTRFSISERRNGFDRALPVMAEYASKYFGQDSKGLVRERVPEGHVDVGEVKSLGAVESP